MATFLICLLWSERPPTFTVFSLLLCFPFAFDETTCLMSTSCNWPPRPLTHSSSQEASRSRTEVSSYASSLPSYCMTTLLQLFPRAAVILNTECILRPNRNYRSVDSDQALPVFCVTSHLGQCVSPAYPPMSDRELFSGNRSEVCYIHTILDPPTPAHYPPGDYVQPSTRRRFMYIERYTIVQNMFVRRKQ